MISTAWGSKPWKRARASTTFWNFPSAKKIGRAKYIEEKDLARFDEISKEMNEAMHGFGGGEHV